MGNSIKKPNMSSTELLEIVQLMIKENDAIPNLEMSAGDWLFELGCYMADKAEKSADRFMINADLNEIMPELSLELN